MAGAALTSWNDDPPGRASLAPSHGKAWVWSRPPIASVASGSAWPGDQPHRTSVPQCSPRSAGGPRSDHPGGVKQRHPLME